MAASRNTQVVRVRRKKLAACMTCPLCKQLLDDATTISECLHSFCRKCIYEKIDDDDVESCPVCHKDLGCAPLEKLRADHSLQDLRAKIFPYLKRETVVVDEVIPAPLPARRKERSLSSLVISTPRVSPQTALTGKRTKTTGKRIAGSRDSTFITEKPIKLVDYGPDSSSSPETLSKFTQSSRRQNLTSTAESSKQQMPEKVTEVSAEACEGKADLWTPLNCLIEAASRTKCNVPNSHNSAEKSGPSGVSDSDAHVPKPKAGERSRKLKLQADENGSCPALTGSLKPKKPQTVRQRIAGGHEGSNIPAKAVLDAPSNKCERVSPIWFSLIAAGNREGVVALPQISSRFLRILDSSVPVSFIKKYIANKLNLQSESEVEIMLQGQPVLPSMQLQHLVERWLQAIPKSLIHTTVGSSAQDFVMVLSYGRKALFLP